MEKEGNIPRRELFSLRGKRKTEKGMGENIWRRIILFCGGEEKWRRKRRKIFGGGKYLFGEEKKTD